MEQLIKITETEGKKVVSARELYCFLTNNAENVTRWMTANIDNNQYAIENIDYQRIMQLAENGRKIEDFALSIDFSKELCMLSQCEKGKQARMYFIEMEKVAISQNTLTHPTRKQLAQWVVELEDQNEKLALENKEKTNTIKELAPKAEVFDQISNSTGLKTVKEVAKILGTGEHRFFAWLREQHILMKSNIPYQQYLEQGYFEVKSTHFNSVFDKVYSQTFFTGRGEAWIARVWKNVTK